MSRVAYVNGRYVAHRDACVHVEDRGYQFADGVYEVCEIRDGAIIDQTRHLDRLERSLGELRIAMPLSRSALKVVMRETVRRNRVRNGLVYLQVTRGVARRDHAFPAPGTPTSLVVTSRSTSREMSDQTAAEGIAVISTPETRWARVDIKTVGLLPNALAKQKAKEAGAKEAWFVDRDGYVTEGSSTTAWIVTADGVLVTRPNGNDILPGVTRRTLDDVARDERVRIEERKFTVAEAQSAREVFLTAASMTVVPIVSIDGVTIGNGVPGSISERLRAAFHANVERTALTRGRGQGVTARAEKRNLQQTIKDRTAING